METEKVKAREAGYKERRHDEISSAILLQGMAKVDCATERKRCDGIPLTVAGREGRRIEDWQRGEGREKTRCIEIQYNAAIVLQYNASIVLYRMK